MRKKDLIKRIELLERQMKNADGPLLTDAKMKAAVHEGTKDVKEHVYELGRVLSIYKDVLMRSGVISNCDADRTEYQWDGSNMMYDPLHRNFHFRVNKVVVEKTTK